MPFPAVPPGENERAGRPERAWPPADCWREWKRRCALDRCGEPARAYLVSFAAARFRRLAARHGGRRGREVPDPSPRECWHLFETHLCADRTRSGKAYKEWLFARCRGSHDDPRQVLEGGATVILRDVVRSHLAREGSRSRDRSLQAPPAGGGPTLEELLPGGIDPLPEVERNELEALAARHAAEQLERICQRERIALLARDLGMPLTHPRVLAAAGCGKSHLHRAHETFIVRLARDLERAHPTETRATIMELALLTLWTVRARLREGVNGEMIFPQDPGAAAGKEALPHAGMAP